MFWLLVTAIATSIHGFSMEAQLTMCASLMEPPQIQFEQPLEDVEVQYGDSVTLFCSVYGAPQAAIKWLHRGRVVASYSAPVVESALHTTRIASGLIESRHHIPCVNRKTLGEYTCEATSPCGEVISSTAFVSLSNSVRAKSSCNVSSNAIAPTIAVTTVSRLELAGSPVQLMCRASGVPKPMIVLSNGDLLVVADSWVTTESYRCSARNPSGVMVADSTIVYVDES
ncbi:unnamed protein product [Nippostrongylus brasiliensis]|uniref:Neural/ectodermal development factor IMP-L2 (inferred by orthology to a D. melanogaster protein) n=1 Tax=Nippostrongylus brasiliensis TaxID=27835 RepID=A0A0N4XX81_NIPBR|nr:unnamed protein product [Nippostrongylus brasiliensis]